MPQSPRRGGQRILTKTVKLTLVVQVQRGIINRCFTCQRAQRPHDGRSSYRGANDTQPVLALVARAVRGISSNGRAAALHAEGSGRIDARILHFVFYVNCSSRTSLFRSRLVPAISGGGGFLSSGLAPVWAWQISYDQLGFVTSGPGVVWNWQC